MLHCSVVAVLEYNGPTRQLDSVEQASKNVYNSLIA